MVNVLSFVLTVWAIATFAAWCFDYLPEIYREWDNKKQVEAALKREREIQALRDSYNSEITVEMPGGSFDPDETMKLSVKKFRKNQEKEFQVVFMFDNKPPKPRRRHAKA